MSYMITLDEFPRSNVDGDQFHAPLRRAFVGSRIR